MRENMYIIAYHSWAMNMKPVPSMAWRYIHVRPKTTT